jgi:hypothetical protein
LFFSHDAAKGVKIFLMAGFRILPFRFDLEGGRAIKADHFRLRTDFGYAPIIYWFDTIFISSFSERGVPPVRCGVCPSE